MKVDPDNSKYHESDSAPSEFNRTELRRLRFLLRRLRFLETQVARNNGMADASASGGAAFAEMEIEALQWLLGEEIGYLQEEVA